MASLPNPPRVPELTPDEKAQLKRDVESELSHMVHDARRDLEKAMADAQTEGERERAQRDYKDTMETMKALANEMFQTRMRELISGRSTRTTSEETSGARRPVNRPKSRSQKRGGSDDKDYTSDSQESESGMNSNSRRTTSNFEVERQQFNERITRLEAALRQKEAESKQLAADVKEHEAVVWRLRQERARESVLNKNRIIYNEAQEADIKLQELEVIRIRDETKRVEEDVQKREEEVKRREVDLRKRLKEVQRKEGDVRVKEEDVEQKITGARRREADARQWEGLLRAQEEELKQRKATFYDEVHAHEEELKRDDVRREEDVGNGRADPSLQEPDVRRMQEEIERMGEELKERVEDVKSWEADLKLREMDVQRLQDEMGQEKEVLEKRAWDLDQREAYLQQRQQNEDLQMRQREGEILLRETVLREDMSAREHVLEMRQASYREVELDRRERDLRVRATVLDERERAFEEERRLRIAEDVRKRDEQDVNTLAREKALKADEQRLGSGLQQLLAERQRLAYERLAFVEEHKVFRLRTAELESSVEDLRLVAHEQELRRQELEAQLQAYRGLAATREPDDTSAAGGGDDIDPDNAYTASGKHLPGHRGSAPLTGCQLPPVTRNSR